MSRTPLEDLPLKYSSAELLRAVYLDRTNNYLTDEKFLEDLGMDEDDAGDVRRALLLCKYLQERDVRPLDVDVDIPFAQYALWHRVRSDLANAEWEDMNYEQARDALTECVQEGLEGLNDAQYEVGYSLTCYLDYLAEAVPEWAVGAFHCQDHTHNFRGKWESAATHQTTDHGDLVHINAEKGEAYVKIPLCSTALVMVATWGTDNEL